MGGGTGKLWSTGQGEHPIGPMRQGRKFRLVLSTKQSLLHVFNQEKDMLRHALLSISLEWGKAGSGVIS